MSLYTIIKCVYNNVYTKICNLNCEFVIIIIIITTTLYWSRYTSLHDHENVLLKNVTGTFKVETKDAGRRIH